MYGQKEAERHKTLATERIYGSSIVMLLHYGSSPLTLNPFQYILEFRTTHRVALCVVHPRYIKSDQTYNKSQD